MDTKCNETFCIKCDMLPSEFWEKRKKDNDAYDKLYGPPSSKKMHLVEEPFPLFELPDFVIHKIWHQLCENDDMKQKFYLALHFIRPNFDIKQQSKDCLIDAYLKSNEFGRNRYEKYIVAYHHEMAWELLRVATDEEYRRKLGLMLPKKLLDSFSDYLLNDFHHTGEYHYFSEIYEIDFRDNKTDHDLHVEDCSECKFVGERNFGGRTKREFLCCEKYYASINLKLLKRLKKEMATQKHFYGSFSYRTAAHTMLSNIVYNSDSLWDPYFKHEFYDEEPHADHHVNFVLDLLKPIDGKIQIKVDNKDVIQQTNISSSIKEFPQFQKKSRKRTTSCTY